MIRSLLFSILDHSGLFFFFLGVQIVNCLRNVGWGVMGQIMTALDGIGDQMVGIRWEEKEGKEKKEREEKTDNKCGRSCKEF